MEAIEIYTKINEVIEKEQTDEVMIALEFVRRKVEQKHYAKESGAKSVAYAGSMLGAGLACSNTVAQQDPVAALRNFVQQEIKAANTELAGGFESCVTSQALHGAERESREFH